jgi:CBS domain containing-hemolysin-like protein
MSAVLLALFFLLILLNGLFVAAEFALVRTRKSKIEALAKDGVTSADAVLDQLERLDEYLSACQVGITLASIGIGSSASPRSPI